MSAWRGVVLAVILALAVAVVWHDDADYRKKRELERTCPVTQKGLVEYIDDSNVHAIAYILDHCPWHINIETLRGYTVLRYALIERKYDVAFAITNHSAPLWVANNGFGVDAIYQAFMRGQWKILDAIYRHPSCQLDAKTYCNRDAAMLLQIPGMLDHVRSQIQDGVQRHKDEQNAQRQRYYARLASSTPEERALMKPLCQEVADVCEDICGMPGKCLVTEISFDLGAQ